MADFTDIETIISQALQTTCPAAQLTIRQHSEEVFSKAYGWLDPETRQHPTQPDTRFDMASVTKLFVVTAFMRLVEAGKVGLDQPVGSVLAEFNGARPIQPYENPLQLGKMVDVAGQSQGSVEAGTVTFRHILCHTSGLPAWRPLFKQPDAVAARRMALTTFFSYIPGERIVYSDIGLILLGLSIERLSGQALDVVVSQQVTAPLALRHTSYLPLSPNSQRPDRFPKNLSGLMSNIAPTEFCQWRQRRVVGEVHDENAWQLDGVSGHAGIFSISQDVAAFGQSFLPFSCHAERSEASSLLRPETIAEMTRVQAEYNQTRRGLGFVLWGTDPAMSGNPFSQSAFGHTGFTGTSLWIDPQRDLVVAFLTNDVYGGREGRGIMGLRIRLHHAIVDAVDREKSYTIQDVK